MQRCIETEKPRREAQLLLAAHAGPEPEKEILVSGEF